MKAAHAFFVVPLWLSQLSGAVALSTLHTEPLEQLMKEMRDTLAVRQQQEYHDRIRQQQKEAARALESQQQQQPQPLSKEAPVLPQVNGGVDPYSSRELRHRLSRHCQRDRPMQKPLFVEVEVKITTMTETAGETAAEGGLTETEQPPRLLLPSMYDDEDYGDRSVEEEAAAIPCGGRRHNLFLGEGSAPLLLTRQYADLLVVGAVLVFLLAVVLTEVVETAGSWYAVLTRLFVSYAEMHSGRELTAEYFSVDRIIRRRRGVIRLHGAEDSLIRRRWNEDENGERDTDEKRCETA